MTTPYRWGHGRMAESGSALEVALTTWVLGTVLIIVGLGVLALTVFLCCDAASRFIDHTFSRAAQGAGTDRLRTLATQHATWTRGVTMIRRLTRIFTPWQSRAGEPGLCEAERPGARRWRHVAQLLAGAASVPRAATGLVRVVLSSLGLLSVAATWWVLGAPGAHWVLDRRPHWIDVDVGAWLGWTAAIVSISGFVLVRLTSRRRRALAEWRRQETMRTTDHLQQRQTATLAAVTATHKALDIALWRWRVRLNRRRHDIDEQIRVLTTELHEELGLSRPRSSWWPRASDSTFGAEHQRQQDATIVEATETLTQLHRLCECDGLTAERFRRWTGRRVKRSAGQVDARFDTASVTGALTAGPSEPTAWLTPLRYFIDATSPPDEVLARAEQAWTQERDELLSDAAGHANRTLWRGWCGWADLDHNTRVIEQELRRSASWADSPTASSRRDPRMFTRTSTTLSTRGPDGVMRQKEASSACSR
ncbi:hypothetical protein ACHAAC_08105 [Aeromicrobium sp. CF4.19]|uniref:hypothetical protein n=1 Tax=Aeromicrobium sp. CF4.19 TaxID=3373082 RepID=UPI003EE5D054